MFSYSNPRRRRLYKRETRFSKARTVVVLLFCSLVWPRLDMDILEMFFKIIISAYFTISSWKIPQAIFWLQLGTQTFALLIVNIPRLPVVQKHENTSNEKNNKNLSEQINLFRNHRLSFKL